MELPEGASRKRTIYNDLIRRCDLVSRAERHQRYLNRRLLALTGTSTGVPAQSNDIREWIGLSSSMLFAVTGVQFGVTLPPYYGGKDESRWTSQDLEEMLELAREEVHRIYSDTSMPAIAHSTVSMAHWSDSAIAKVYVQRNQTTLGLIPDYSDFCVLDEARPFEEQEAFVHFYSMSLPAFWRMLYALYPKDDKERERIWQAALVNQRDQGEGRGDVLPGALPRLMVAATSPNMIGNVVSVPDSNLGRAKAKDPVIDLAELWVWDDRAGEICAKCDGRKMDWRHFEAGHNVYHEFKSCDPPVYVPDWRVATQLVDTFDILKDVVNPNGIAGEHPFFPLSLSDPDILSGYCWGVAPMEQQISLQSWGERKWSELDARDELDMNPPMSAFGVPMRDGEISKRYRAPGGDIPLSNPNSKVEFHRPPPLADPFGFVDRIHAMKRRSQGIPDLMSGTTQPGVRGGEQALTHAMLGAGPTLNRAMAVERWLGAIMTYVLRMERNISDRFLVRNDGSRFLLRHMPGDFVVRVWAHSASPIYTEQLAMKARVAFKDRAISRRSYLRYLNLPGTDMLLRDTQKLEESEAQAGQKAAELKEREVKAKEERARKA